MQADLTIIDYQVTFDASMRSQSTPIPIRAKNKRLTHPCESTSTTLTVPYTFYKASTKSLFPIFLTPALNQSIAIPHILNTFHFLSIKELAYARLVNKLWKKFSQADELALDASKRLYKTLRSTPFTQIKRSSIKTQDWCNTFKKTYYLRFINTKDQIKFEFSIYTYPILAPDVIFKDILEIKSIKGRNFFRKKQMKLTVINKALTKNQLTFTRNVVKIINDERENIGKKEAEAFPYFARIQKDQLL